MSRMTPLAAQQSALLEALFAINNRAIEAINTSTSIENNHKIRGFQTYQANAAALAVRSLQSTYPVIAQLIGEHAFALLARDLWTQYPPVRGDMAQWGGDLPVFITSISALQTEPYLSDVARAEWALHVTASAADQSADMATFSLLSAHEPDTVSLQFAPGIALISSRYPVASILTAHLYAQPTFEAVGQKIRAVTPETALVWRQGLRPMLASCEAGEAVFLSQILAGKSLLAALEMPQMLQRSGTPGMPEAQFADESVGLDFNTWLPRAVQSGLLLGARLL
jgi:Putative DNA-binding domain